MARPAKSEDPAVLLPVEAARELRMSRAQFYKWLASGTCPLTPLRAGGRTLRISRKQLDRYMAGEAIDGRAS